MATLLLLLANLAGPAYAQPAPPTIPALFLSDIHLDPYSDPAKVAKLNAAPASEWAAILDAPASPTQAADFAALHQSCATRGDDTTNQLFRSSLRAIHRDAAHATFVTISGDLLAHKFDCKYSTLLPKASHADYVAFTAKTIRYIVDSLRDALPGIPIYVSLGNNDSGCTDYALDPTHDEFLALTAKIVAEAQPEANRADVLRDFPAGGYYNVPLAGVSHTRLVVLDDLYASGKYVTCADKPDTEPAATQLAWLQDQLAAASAAHEHVWVMSHIPPGVDLYGSAKKLLVGMGCTRNPTMFLHSEKLAEVLTSSPGIVTLALFGHTHSDEMRLLEPEASGASARDGVPLKITASITPINGNNPSFTLARVDPATSTLMDYTVVMASNAAGNASTTWTPEYTYSTTYHQPAFNAASLNTLIAGFQADPAGAKPASQAYLRNFFPGDASPVIHLVWPQYACSLNHDTAASFAACSCKAQ
jgi:sphingomyelin phosphodiesterase acid-like 3